MDAPATGGGPVVVGASYATSPNAVLDALDISAEELPELYDRMRQAGIEQAMVLSTCDRTDIWALHPEPENGKTRLTEILARQAGLPATELVSDLYRLSGKDAVRRIFGVAASLESRLTGEPQVLGQVKESHRKAAAGGMVGTAMDTLLDAAYTAAKRVRTETGIGERPVSIASAATRIARDIQGDLSSVRALVLGAGDIAITIADSLRLAGVSDFVVLTPGDHRAEALAKQLGGHHAPMGTLASQLVNADIVITGIGNGTYVLDAPGIRTALAARRQKPVFLIDGGMPADIDPAAGTPDGAFLYTLDDLEQVALRGRTARRDEAAEAHRIIDEEVAAYFKRTEARAAAPLVADLRRHFERVRRDLLEEAGEKNTEEVTRLLINRLLHTPSVMLGTVRDDTAEGVLRRLFDLENQSTENQNTNGSEDKEDKS